MPHLLGDELKAAFTPKALMDAYPALPFKAKFQAVGALSAAFAVEAMRRDVVRCVSFTLGGLDTHNANYKQHAHTQHAQSETEYATYDGEQDTLGEKLPDDPATSSAHGRADCDFALAASGPNQQQVRHIGTSDQKHAADRRQQHI